MLLQHSSPSPNVRGPRVNAVNGIQSRPHAQPTSLRHHQCGRAPRPADTAVSAHAAPGVTTPAAPIDNASTATAPGVVVQLAATSLTSRTLAASVDIAAPVAVVWGALTDYERLGTFIPNLAENRCLERRPNGAVLYQVGAQEVAMGIRFCAAVTLECVEHEVGVPRAMCTTSRDGLDGPLFPWPSCSLPDRGARDITFALVKGDFKNFKGVWRLQQGAGGADTTHLVYSLFVQPQAWLPVGLIQNRISREVATNLQAVRQHSERLYLAGSAGDGELQRQPQSVQPM